MQAAAAVALSASARSAMAWPRRSSKSAVGAKAGPPDPVAHEIALPAKY